MTRAIDIGSRLAVLGVLIWVSSVAAGADWPTHRYDAGRSAFSPEQLAPALHRQWTYVPRHAPRPAWPEPVREVGTGSDALVCHVSETGSYSSTLATLPVDPRPPTTATVPFNTAANA